jgi:short-subunit dehydrogenase
VRSSQVAVITGATRGIGLALAEALLKEGMIVYAVGVDEKRVAELAARLAHPRLHARRLDVASRSALEGLLAEVESAHHRLDWMVNNAGVLAGGELADMSEAQMERLVDVNLWGVIHGSRLAAQRMRRQKSGHIINVASMAGVFPVPFSAVYTATKHAVFGFSLALREELRSYGVSAHVVCPDVVDTGIFDRADDNAGYSYRNIINRHLSRAITVEEAVGCIIAGVDKDRAVIYAPNRSRAIGAVGRMFPSFIARQVAMRMAPNGHGQAKGSGS